jgi:hypothetical protein
MGGSYMHFFTTKQHLFRCIIRGNYICIKKKLSYNKKYLSTWKRINATKICYSGHQHFVMASKMLRCIEQCCILGLSQQQRLDSTVVAPNGRSSLAVWFYVTKQPHAVLFAGNIAIVTSRMYAAICCNVETAAAVTTESLVDKNANCPLR